MTYGLRSDYFVTYSYVRTYIIHTHIHTYIHHCHIWHRNKLSRCQLELLVSYSDDEHQTSLKWDRSSHPVAPECRVSLTLRLQHSEWMCKAVCRSCSSFRIAGSTVGYLWYTVVTEASISLNWPPVVWPYVDGLLYCLFEHLHFVYGGIKWSCSVTFREQLKSSHRVGNIVSVYNLTSVGFLMLGAL